MLLSLKKGPLANCCSCLEPRDFSRSEEGGRGAAARSCDAPWGRAQSRAVTGGLWGPGRWQCRGDPALQPCGGQGAATWSGVIADKHPAPHRVQHVNPPALSPSQGPRCDRGSTNPTGCSTRSCPRSHRTRAARVATLQGPWARPTTLSCSCCGAGSAHGECWSLGQELLRAAQRCHVTPQHAGDVHRCFPIWNSSCLNTELSSACLECSQSQEARGRPLSPSRAAQHHVPCP